MVVKPADKGGAVVFHKYLAHKLWWSLCTLYVHAMSGESYRRRLRSLLLYLCYVFRAHKLWWSLCTLYLHACQVRVTVGDSGLCCCTCVTYF